MAYGVHWEWRGFGRISARLRAGIEQLKAQYPAPARITDEYLWVPGTQINLKLRSIGAGTLKFKRLLGTDSVAGLELWQERAEEDYRFPIDARVAEALGAALGVRIKPIAPTLGREELLVLLRSANASIQVVTVNKMRRGRFYPTPHGRLIVEIAEIESPQRISSVGVEDDFGLSVEAPAEQRERARKAVADFVVAYDLEKEVAAANYIDATAQWASGTQLSI